MGRPNDICQALFHLYAPELRDGSYARSDLSDGPRILIRVEGECPAFIRLLWQPRRRQIRSASASQGMSDDDSAFWGWNVSLKEMMIRVVDKACNVAFMQNVSPEPDGARSELRLHMSD